MTGLKLWDATGGFKCFHRRVLQAIDLDDVRSNGYAFQIETTWRALQRGMRVVEVPICFVDRRVGRSKMDARIFAEAIGAVLRMRVTGSGGRLL